MKKSILRAIPCIAWNVDWNHFVSQLSGTSIKFFAHTSIEKVDKERVLIMSIFSKDKIINFRIFISEDDYITQEYLADGSFKWRTGSMDNVLNFGYYSYGDDIAFVEHESVDMIYGFLGEGRNPVNSITKHQEVIKGKRLDKRHQKEKDEIDERMNRVKDIPKNFAKWVEEKALFKSRYIIYKYASRRMLDGYCTHCKTDVKVERPRHNEEGICPNCNSPITFKASGKVSTLYDASDIALIQKAGDELVVRYFYVAKNYMHGKYRSPELHINERARDFYTSNGDFKVSEFEWARFKQTDEYRWCKNNNYNRIDVPTLYPSNLTRELKGTRYEYSALDLYAKTEVDFKFPVWRYLSLYPVFNAIEYFVKMRLTTLTSQVLSVYKHEIEKTLNLKGETVKEILGISKDRINALVKLNGGLKAVRILKLSNEREIHLTEEQVEIIIEHYDEDIMFEVMKYTTFHKAHRYVSKQLCRYGKNGYNDRLNSYLSTYRDYLRDCKFLDYNLKKDYFLFPKNLNEAHQDTISLIKVKKDEIIDKRLVEMFKSLKEKFIWENNDFIVIPPKSHEELIEEGSSLKHCVARMYGKKMAEGEAIVLFIRKKDNIDKPFYTIEVSPDDYSIKQCRGQNNCNPEGEVEVVVEKYKEKLQSLKMAS